MYLIINQKNNYNHVSTFENILDRSNIIHIGTFKRQADGLVMICLLNLSIDKN